MSVHVFGIRHHGPGCARALNLALAELQPDCVLIEGPPDAQEVLALAVHEELKPPVAMLVYPADEPDQAVYFPFASYSPELQAIRWGLAHGATVRFIDLPQSIRFAQDRARRETFEKELAAQAAAAEEASAASAPVAADEGTDETAAHAEELPAAPAVEEADLLRRDPLALLAEAAGFTDHELWWDRQIEHRQQAADLFAAIREAMTAVREAAPTPENHDLLREAHMRQGIRAAEKEGFAKIAVVCGAYHAPVLAERGPAAADAELLKGLPKVKTVATWIPWTNRRLAIRSGYGAGVTSPGWYEHLWEAPDRATIRWAARAARLLRSEDLDASSASVIETVRLAEALAALRGLSLPGLNELQEAVQTVLCFGSASPMRLIRNRLEIGEVLGRVPADAPAVPLQRDLEGWQKTLRLKASDAIETLTLDLRKENDLARSRLFHRLKLLDLPWGQEVNVGGQGTFKEGWKTRWEPEFSVRIIEANVYGNTVEEAATSKAKQQADAQDALPTLTELLDQTILGELPAATDHVLQRVQTQAALSADVRHLMQALPPLARVARYGDVRKTRADQVVPVIRGLFERILVSLPGACAAIDDQAAAEIVDHCQHVQQAIEVLQEESQRTAWLDLATTLLHNDAAHGLIRGWCCRLLLEQGRIDSAELQRLAGLALSIANPPLEAGAWIEGLLRGSGLVVLHQDGLWHALNRWLCHLNAEVFPEMLPLLRRAFAGFQPAERRQMGDKVKHLGVDLGAAPLPVKRAAESAAVPLDHERGKLVLPVLAHLLGLPS